MLAIVYYKLPETHFERIFWDSRTAGWTLPVDVNRL